MESYVQNIEEPITFVKDHYLRRNQPYMTDLLCVTDYADSPLPPRITSPSILAFTIKPLHSQTPLAR